MYIIFISMILNDTFVFNWLVLLAISHNININMFDGCTIQSCIAQCRKFSGHEVEAQLNLHEINEIAFVSWMVTDVAIERVRILKNLVDCSAKMLLSSLNMAGAIDKYIA